MTKKEQERDFKRRMRDAERARKVRADHDHAEQQRVAKFETKEVATHRTGRFKVAKSFRAGHGRFS